MHEELVHDHIKQIAELVRTSESHEKRLDNVDKLVSSVQEIAIGFTKLVGTVDQQSKDLTIMVRTLERHEDKIEGIEQKMETKDTVARLHGRVEELQTLLTQQEDNREKEIIKEYNDMKKFVSKALFGAGVFVAGSLIIFAVIVLMGMANAGAIPIP
jgi:DNA repair exonuclease SbcCD ATPase subunit